MAEVIEEVLEGPLLLAALTAPVKVEVVPVDKVVPKFQAQRSPFS